MLSIVSSVLLTGCAVNNFGTVKTTPYENDSAYLLELEAWGIHLSTHAADAGLSIGHIQKTYVVRKSNHGAKKKVRVEDLLFSEKLRKMDNHPSQLDFKNIIALTDTISGLKIYGNTWRGVGIMVGFQNHAAMRLPRNFNGIIAINLDREHKDHNLVNIQEVME
jgi:hypothetical protein